MATSSKRTRRKEFDRINGVLIYARFVYCLDGLDDGIDDLQALAIGRDPDEFGADDKNKVPEESAPYEDLINPRFRVSFSSRIRGRALVDVRWGRRTSGFGPATDVEGVTSQTVAGKIIIPFIGKLGGDIAGQQSDLTEVKEIVIERPRTITNRRVILPSGQSADAVNAFMLQNIGKLYPSYGILANASVQEINQSQYYVITQFVNNGEVKEYAAGEIEPGSSKIDFLPINGVYKRPDLSNVANGTGVDEAADVYLEGDPIPWLP